MTDSDLHLIGIVTLVVVVSWAIIQLYRIVKRQDDEREHLERVAFEARRQARLEHARGFEEPVTRGGKPHYGGWYHHPEAVAERRRGMQHAANDALLCRWLELIDEQRTEEEA